MQCASRLFNLQMIVMIASTILCRTVLAQATLGNPKEWPDPIRWIVEDKDRLSRAENAVRWQLRQDGRTEEMACALALIEVTQGDPQQVHQALRGLKQVFPSPSTRTSAFCDRMKLWSSLRCEPTERDEPAEAVFKRLSLIIHRGVEPLEEQRVTASMLGAVCGMLDVEQAASPIASEHLATCRRIISASTDSRVRSEFKESEERNRKRTDFLSSLMSKIDTDGGGPEATKTLLAEAENELEQTAQEHKDAVESVESAKELTEMNERQRAPNRRTFQSQLRTVMNEERLQTPGHPGREPSEPKQPTNRSRPGDLSDKADREWIAYERAVSDLPERRERWRDAMDAWEEADKKRRGELATQKSRAQSELRAIAVATEADQKIVQAAQKQAREALNRIEDCRMRIELTTTVRTIQKTQHPEYAYRAEYHPLVDLPAEQYRLLQLAKRGD